MQNNNKTIQEVVLTKISESGENVFNNVVNKFVDIEINSRVDLIMSGCKKQDELEKMIKKISKNDVITYIDGQAVEVMSQARYDEIKKQKEKLNRLVSCLYEALNKNSSETYKVLQEVIQKLGDDNGNKKQGDTNSESK